MRRSLSHPSSKYMKQSTPERRSTSVRYAGKNLRNWAIKWPISQSTLVPDPTNVNTAPRPSDCSLRSPFTIAYTLGKGPLSARHAAALSSSTGTFGNTRKHIWNPDSFIAMVFRSGGRVCLKFNAESKLFVFLQLQLCVTYQIGSNLGSFSSMFLDSSTPTFSWHVLRVVMMRPSVKWKGKSGALI